MVFKRNTPRNFLAGLRNHMWPDMGWMRYLLYLKQRVVRLADSPRNIALGLAFGLAASFNPFVGTHILQAAGASLLFRANVLASAIGTFFGNPLTFSFMWYAAYATGRVLFNIFGFEASAIVDSGLSFSDLLTLAQSQPQQILWPWIVGAYVIALVITPLSYMIFYPLIKAAKDLREARKKKDQL